MADRVRITVELAGVPLQQVNDLSASRAQSRQDVIRSAIELLIMTDAAKEDGYTPGAWGNGKQVEFVYG